MIVNLPNTTSSQIGKRLQELRESGGVVALGRVLTLLIETDFAHIEEAVEAANSASRAHPSRIIVLADDDGAQLAESRLDAEIRVGGDAGASEVVILRAHGQAANNAESLVTGLLLPDAPVVAWWPAVCGSNPSSTAIGKIATRRIVDSAEQPEPIEFLRNLAKHYRPGDGDMAWTRITLWRAQLAALFDQHLHRIVQAVTVIGSDLSPSTELLAKWLELSLKVRVNVEHTLDGVNVEGIAGVVISFDSGELKLVRREEVAHIDQVDAPHSSVLLPRRSNQDCLVEDMRFLGEDETFGRVLTQGFAK
ncbi:glucose-6-phosphate dehydrogenase assembly protein OpcA [Aquiluna borgnonia]|uniref:Glucose-6-phosphate dehydrogenase assembly protein OpcA n=1 Tax=Aquiluna borgnonia TaxID=2499157 RepID=A0A7D4UDC9_9MICO|nr:glucose-6-phosphate dehydrogenase assembly protein OpcA [Aquiluna borgnonia]QKJ25314.1 glucose-6-phosphate dehydrogenase assembly protein OpcA [Aquiluna borgnonia]